MRTYSVLKQLFGPITLLVCSVLVSQTATAQNTITVADANRAEDNVSFDLAVQVAGPGPYPLTVSYNTINGTALRGSDFSGPASGSLTFAAAGTQPVSYIAIADALVEPATESYTVQFTAPSATARTATVSIASTDTSVVEIRPARIGEGQNGNSAMHFMVAASRPIQGGLTFTASTINNTASAPSDFVPLVSVPIALPTIAELLFGGGSEGKVTVQIIGDGALELDESFSVSGTVSLPPGITGVTFGALTATGTITNDDGGQILTVDTDINDLPANLSACTSAANDCSYRGALVRSDALPGPDTIAFSIPGAGVKTINLVGGCAQTFSTDPLVIDGYTQPGTLPNTNVSGGLNGTLLIELVIDNTGCKQQLFRSLDLTLRGLAMRFDTPLANANFLVRLLSNGGTAGIHRIEGNYFGTNAAGSPVGNTIIDTVGLTIDNGRNNGTIFVGCGGPATRNLFSHLGTGLNYNSVMNGEICGNLFGSNAAGLAGVPNHVSIAAPQGAAERVRALTIGGVEVAQRNVFGAATLTHVDLVPSYTLIRNNWFGLTANGASQISSPGIGVRLQSVVESQVLFNTFRGLGGSSVAFISTTSARNRILDNSSAGSAGLAIDNAPFAGARRPNDAGDPDGTSPGSFLANQGQNFPVITSYTPGASTTLNYSIDTLPIHGAYPIRMQFFKTLDDESETFLGEHSAPAPGNHSYTFNPPVSLDGDSIVVATATDADGNTSEVSFYPVSLSLSASPQPALDNQPVTISVSAVSTGPFKPRGPVVIRNATTEAVLCTANLAPTATVATSMGSCQIPARPPVTLEVDGRLNTLQSAFAGSNGFSAISPRISVTWNPREVVFANGFE